MNEKPKYPLDKLVLKDVKEPEIKFDKDHLLVYVEVCGSCGHKLPEEKTFYHDEETLKKIYSFQIEGPIPTPREHLPPAECQHCGYMNYFEEEGPKDRVLN